MRQIETFEQLAKLFTDLDSDDALEKAGFRADMGQSKAEIVLTDLRYRVTVIDICGYEVDEYRERPIGVWHADETGLSFRYEHETAPEALVQTAKNAVKATRVIADNWRRTNSAAPQSPHIP